MKSIFSKSFKAKNTLECDLWYTWRRCVLWSLSRVLDRTDMQVFGAGVHIPLSLQAFSVCLSSIALDWKVVWDKHDPSFYQAYFNCCSRMYDMPEKNVCYGIE